jgi:predicted phage terminase large subunit-like protein
MTTAVYDELATLIAEALEEGPNDAPRESFRDYIVRVHPRYVFYDHCEKLVSVLQDVANGTKKRVIILAPPRHGKSETVSRLFPGYLISQWPTEWVGLASYSASLAYKMSRAARDFARKAGVSLRGDAEAVAEWETTAGGGLWAVGVGGSATGRGMKWGILDDPIKNAEEAASEVIGERNRDWWNSTWYTRQEPDAALVVMCTRWPGPGDLTGWLLEQETADEHPERWHVVALEAEKTAEAYDIPSTCTLEPDARQPGEALCPPRYPVEKLRSIASRIGAYFYRSLFQQRKAERTGKMFKWDWWREVPTVPACRKFVRYLDLAGTEPKRKGHDPDYTASTLMGEMDDLRRVILDVTEERLSVGERDASLIELAKADAKTYQHRVTWWIEREAGIGGTDRTESLVRRLQATGITVRTEPATGDKVLRAEPLAAAAEAGNVLIAPGAWRDRFRRHMAEFGRVCPHDDIADATSGAYNKLSAPVASISPLRARV